MTPRSLALVLAMFALPLAPARAATIDAVMDAAEATLVGPVGIPAIKAACTAEGCAACPAGSPIPAAALAFDHDEAASRGAWRHLVALAALSDPAAADAAEHAYHGTMLGDIIALDSRPMAALGLHADDLADSAAVYWQSLQEIATNDWHAPTLTVFSLPSWEDTNPAVATAKARIGPLAARLRAALRCDPALAGMTALDRGELGYALHLQTVLLHVLYTATFEQNKAATEAVSDAVEKAVAAKGLDLRRGLIAP